MDEFNLPNQHTRSASHTRACADAGRKRSASRQSEIRTNVADVDDVEGLLRLPGLGLLDQVAARLILAGLQRVLLFLRLGVVVRPQLCHLPSRQLKLPTQRDRNGEPSASGNSSSLPPPIRNRNVRGSGAHPLPVRQRRVRILRILQYHCVPGLPHRIPAALHVIVHTIVAKALYSANSDPTAATARTASRCLGSIVGTYHWSLYPLID